MNILILNWRDIKNPESGGAEVLTHEIAKRWVNVGNRVTICTSSFQGARKYELIDGVEIVRIGYSDALLLTLSVHIGAFFWYRSQPRNRFDVVVDEIHGIPYFTPWYVKQKKIALICEVAKDIWDVSFSFPLNRIGRWVESSYFHIYKDIPFLTISPSTKQELLEMGVKEKNITILPMGISTPKEIRLYKKEYTPTLIFVARLTKAKGLEDALGVIRHLKDHVPDIRLWIVGQGDPYFVDQMKLATERLNIQDNVTFFGFVTQEKKFELMARAHLLIVSSIKEGWGLTIPEAGYVQTPAVGYDVPGLRDVIVDGKSGVLSPLGANHMARGILHILNNKNLYKKLQKGARQLAQKSTWDHTAAVALSALNHV